MDSLFYLALRYILFHRLKSSILVLCVSLSIFLPLVGKTVLDNVEVELRSRARSTPYVVGAKGSRFDLTLHALYLDVAPPETIDYAVYRMMREAKPGNVIAIYRNHVIQDGLPLVGIGLEYFEFRQLELDSGKWFGRIGHCVIGSEVAKRLQIGVGDKVLSKPGNDVNLAGATPVKMEVTGILKPAGSSDDGAVFTDLKTAWVIDGLGHGHQDIEKEHDPNLFLERKENAATVNQGVVPYIEITDENVSTIHFHGDTNTFPLTAVLLDPRDEKSATLLKSRIENDPASGLQMVRPETVIGQLLSRILKVKTLFDVGSVTLLATTLLFLVLNTVLSIRLRKREMTTLYKIGCGRLAIFGLFLSEYLIIFLVSLLLASAMTWVSVDWLQAVVLRAIR